VGAPGPAALAVLAERVTIPFGNTIEVTVLRPAATDQFGDPTGDPTESTVAGCVMWLDEGSEDTDHADTVTGLAVLVAPPGTDLRAIDQVQVSGQTWEVIGDPLARRSPFTSAQLVQARLRKVTG